MSTPEPAAAVLARIEAWAAGRDTIRAVLLTGSRARHGARLDEFSDYDVALYVTDPHAYLAEPGWHEALGGVLVSFRDRDALDPSGRHTQLVLYEDGVKVDHTIAPIDELVRLSAGARRSSELEATFARRTVPPCSARSTCSDALRTPWRSARRLSTRSGSTPG